MDQTNDQVDENTGRFGVELGDETRPVWRSITRGFRTKCPSCGDAPVFSANLSVVDNCTSCNEELHHHRADDLPAYLNIFLVGHIVVGVMMVVMTFGFCRCGR